MKQNIVQNREKRMQFKKNKVKSTKYLKAKKRHCRVTSLKL